MTAANPPFAENALLKAALPKLKDTVILLCYCYSLLGRYPARHRTTALGKMFHTNNAMCVDDAVLRLCCSVAFFTSMFLSHTHGSNKWPRPPFKSRKAWKATVWGSHRRSNSTFVFSMTGGRLLLGSSGKGLAPKVQWKPCKSPEQGTKCNPPSEDGKCFSY